MILCKRCGIEKDTSSFGRDKRRATGLTLWCRDCNNEYRRNHYKKDLSKSQALSRKHQLQERLSAPERCRERNRIWKRDNKGWVNADTAKRRAFRLNATVGWADEGYMRDLYEYAKEASEIFGVVFHVDHIVPLINDDVCGLHCEDNLQVLPAVLNLEKSNKFRSSV